MRMTFVSNHDHNHAAGTEYERFGPALGAVTVLSVVGEGIPLVYTGQELGNRRRLAFFDKDLVSGDDAHQAELYRHLFALKRVTPALWNGGWGGRMVRVPNDDEKHVLSFVRSAGDSRVFAVFNLSEESRWVAFGDGPHPGDYRDAFDDEAVSVAPGDRFELAPWAWRVLVA